jgi:glycosyltransferase involved in cell wall biosynthesis
MKILVVGHSIGHPRQRGVWKYIAKQGHKVLLVSPQGVDGGIYQNETDGNFQLILMPAVGSDLPHFWFIPGVHEIVEKFKPDFIYCMQEPWEFQSFELANLAELYRIPFGFFTWENLPKVFPQPYRAMDNKVLTVSDLSVCGNLEGAQILARKGARNVNVMLQTGLDETLLFPDPKIKVDNRKEPIKLLYIGRLVEAKGISMLLDMMNILDDNYELRIVGGKGEEEIVNMIKNHPKLGTTISVEEWVSYEKVREIYNWADLVLVPSVDTEQWKEQCGYVIGESILCGTPVITTTSSSIVQIWGKCPGVEFINQGDLGTLIDIITSFAPFETKEGREYVIENFSHTAIGDALIEMIGEVV